MHPKIPSTATGLIIGGQPIPIPGHLSLRIYNFQDSPALRPGKEDYRSRRTKWVRNICLHTRLGKKPPQIFPAPIGGTPGQWNVRYPTVCREDGERRASAHLSIDAYGVIGCHLDLLREAAYHAGPVNEVSIGIELYQEPDGAMYEPTFVSAVALVDELTYWFQIQRQYEGHPSHLPRFMDPNPRSPDYHPEGRRGVDFVGVFGHRNVTRRRGPGDPGNEIFPRLAAAGYEALRPGDTDAVGFETWAKRQEQAGMDPRDCDGIPGPRTVKAFARMGRPRGLWVARPGDTRGEEGIY